jgi:hypothetical protein
VTNRKGREETDTTQGSQSHRLEKFVRVCVFKMIWLLGLLILFFGVSYGATPIWVDFSGYDPSCGIQVVQEGPLLQVIWPGERGQVLRIRFNLGDLNLLIRDMSVSRSSAFVPVLENVSPQYMCFTGKRRGGWDNFFDTPPSYRAEIRTYDSSLAGNMCHVTSDHQRVQVAINGLAVGIFRGQLIFTFYKGSNLVQQEAVVHTEEQDVAYYYDAWLTHCSTKNLKNLTWLNTEGELVRDVIVSQLDYLLQIPKVRSRTIVAEGPNGSLGLFPPPHKFFFARDETVNFGYVWHRLYSITEQEDLFSFGIRQDPAFGPDEPAPLYNAPPGTEQRWKLFYYISEGAAGEALRGISAFTHNDSFKALPGYQTYTSHFHMRVAMTSLAHNRKPYVPEFKEVFKQMGVKMVNLAEFHGDGHPYASTPTRLEELQAEYDECKRLSDKEFLLIPGEEGMTYLGGHWSLLFPRPVYWFWVRPEPFQDRVAPFGDVYHLGSAADTYKLIVKENGLVWQTHPRTKSSVDYPDRLVKQDYYQDSRWVGAAFKDMPNDLSSPRLGDRALKLLDDMNNWGGRRFLIGEIDVFRIDHTHELYGHMNINYLRMDRLPLYPDWGDVLKALSRGDFFVTSGEVLIRDFLVGGKRSGENLSVARGSAVEISADLEWTFPLNIVELVWGDGKEVNRTVLTAGDTPQFGQRPFKFTKDLTGLRWIRLAAWDVAANGAFTQPVYIQVAKD